MREQASQQLDCLVQIPTPSLIQRTWATVIGLIKRHEATRVQIDKMNRTMLLLSTAVALSGCSATNTEDQYLGQSPTLSLSQFFDGEIKAWGIVQNRSGHLVQRFAVDIIGTNDGTTLTLHETFSYMLGDGPRTRIWEITFEDGLYTGRADDIEGTASGRSFGNAFRWSYEMDLPVGDNEYRVQFDDWMWAMDENTLMNRSEIKKFGLVMAEVTIFMQKVPPRDG